MPPRAGYIVSNAPDVGSNLDIAEPDALDFNLLGNFRFGVISGYTVAVTGSLFTINVAQGVWMVNGQVAAGTGQVTLATASTNPRFDLVVGNSAGVISAITGTASVNPVFPFYDNTVCVFAAVLVVPGTTVLTQAQVTDKRIMVPERFATAITNGGLLLSNKDPTLGQALKNLFSIDPNGKHAWLADTFLERTAAGKIKITNTLDVATLLTTAITVAGNLTSGGDLISQNFNQGAGNPTVAGTEAPGDIYKNLTTGSVWVWQSGAWVQMSTTVIPTGMTMWGMMPSPPSGWLLMNGQTVSQATAGGLWTMFPSWQVGANMVIPDATNCFIGWGTPGVKAGNPSVNLTIGINNLPAHNHLASPTTNAGGSHVHTASESPAGAHGHPSQHDGAHIHDVYDPGHIHPAPPGSDGILVSITGSPYPLPASVVTPVHSYNLGNTGPNVDVVGHGTTGTQVLTTSSNHDHTVTAAVDHTHTVTVASGGGSHSHPITENVIGGGVPIDIRPPFMGAFLYIKT